MVRNHLTRRSFDPEPGNPENYYLTQIIFHSLTNCRKNQIPICIRNKLKKGYIVTSVFYFREHCFLKEIPEKRRRRRFKPP